MHKKLKHKESKSIKQIPLKFGIKARGASELKKHLSGSRLTARQAIKACCYECMGGYSDGKMDCNIPECPLYPFFPYKN